MAQPDILTDIFSTLKIRGELYFRTDLLGNFAIELPEERRRIRFHLVLQGGCWIRIAKFKPVEMIQGDLALVPHGTAQILSTHPDEDAVPLANILGTDALVDGILRHGNGDRRTRLLCGFCRFDEAIDHPMMATLPGLVVLRPHSLGGEPWVAAALRLLALESELDAAGTTGILSRLLEILLIQAVRHRISDMDRTGHGFVAALSDQHLSRALDAIHNQPELAWTIGELARVAGMSRARFADRFTTHIGEPPIRYLTTWRLMKARALLTDTGLDMGEIARRCGYASVPSFSRRFKSAFSVGPGAYRRTARSD